MQKPKHKLSAEAKKKIQKDCDDYIKLSVIYGHKKALEILKQRKESEVEGEWYQMQLLRVLRCL